MADGPAPFGDGTTSRHVRRPTGIARTGRDGSRSRLPRSRWIAPLMPQSPCIRCPLRNNARTRKARRREPRRAVRVVRDRRRRMRRRGSRDRGGLPRLPPLSRLVPNTMTDCRPARSWYLTHPAPAARQPRGDAECRFPDGRRPERPRRCQAMPSASTCSVVSTSPNVSDSAASVARWRSRCGTVPPSATSRSRVAHASSTTITA